jgi:hypothetical protein
VLYEWRVVGGVMVRAGAQALHQELELEDRYEELTRQLQYADGVMKCVRDGGTCLRVRVERGYNWVGVGGCFIECVCVARGARAHSRMVVCVRAHPLAIGGGWGPNACVRTGGCSACRFTMELSSQAHSAAATKQSHKMEVYIIALIAVEVFFGIVDHWEMFMALKLV